jgi:crotonobetainyl-CoA:carnitine CoA-transferase CaiB-like acyl-CoA transferase
MVPLAGLRVLDFTIFWSGPLACRMLADYGADVIKVEGPKYIDQGRTRGMDFIDGIDPLVGSPFFKQLNRNKRSIVLDLTMEAGYEAAAKLCSWADVLVENFRPGVLDGLGLGFEDVAKRNPKIVYVSLSGFGRTGLDSATRAFGNLVEIAAGLDGLTGYPGDDTPMSSGFAYPDLACGMGAVGAICLALLEQKESGTPQFVELSEQEFMINFLGEEFTGVGEPGPVVHRGNQSLWWAPQGCYRAAGDDAWVVLSCTDDRQFRALAKAMGKPEVADDPRFVSATARLEHQAELDRFIAEWTKTLGVYDVMFRLQADGVPAAPVMSSPRLYSDPHCRERQLWRLLDDVGHDRWPVDRAAWLYSAFEAVEPRFTARLGEHTEEILAEAVGYSKDQIADLLSRGAALAWQRPQPQ